MYCIPMNKPFSQACVNNAGSIAKVIKPYVASKKNLLEIGSGTGQHAVYIGGHFSQLLWQTSDLSSNHPGIKQWLEESGKSNLLSPLVYDVTHGAPASEAYDVVFTANTLHIMPWSAAQECITQAASLLKPKGLLLVYGPFNYDGTYTCESNRDFDQYLRSVHPKQGIRDFERVNQVALESGFRLLNDHKMPANNRLLAWQLHSD